MKTNLNSKIRKEIVNKLYIRFSEYQRMTVDNLVTELFEPKDTYTYIKGKEKVKSIISSLKRRFMSEGKFFGSVDDVGNFGLPTTEFEYKYIVTEYYGFTKGMIFRASFAATEGKDKGLLKPSNERVLVPVILPEGKEEE